MGILTCLSVFFCGAQIPFRIMAFPYANSWLHSLGTEHSVGPLYMSDQELYLATYNTHRRQTSMPQTGFEPKMTACQRPHTQPESMMPLQSEIQGITFTYKYFSFIVFWNTHIQVVLQFQNVTAEDARNPYISNFIQNKLDVAPVANVLNFVQEAFIQARV